MADDLTEIELRRLEEERSEDEGMAPHPEKERDPAVWEKERHLRERPLNFLEQIAFDARVAFHRRFGRAVDAAQEKVSDHPIAAIASVFLLGVSVGCLVSAKRRR
jgi:ElaB/YqjD/DUF883 family membrane-anchored ribosome-binding protein